MAYTHIVLRTGGIAMMSLQGKPVFYPFQNCTQKKYLAEHSLDGDKASTMSQILSTYCHSLRGGLGPFSGQLEWGLDILMSWIASSWRAPGRIHRAQVAGIYTIQPSLAFFSDLIISRSHSNRNLFVSLSTIPVLSPF